MQMEIIQPESQQILDDRYNQLLVAEQAMLQAERHKFEVWGLQLTNINHFTLFQNSHFRYDNIGEYAEDRLDISSTQAYRLIEAHKICDQIKQIGEYHSPIGEYHSPILPTKETHIRPLAKLPTPEDRAVVWQSVVSDANGTGITAKKVEAAVQRYQAAKEKNWITLSEWENGERISQVASKKTMNSQDDNQNIEWAAFSWNPVTGCLHNCDYCYARDIANRFFPQKFEPSFIPERLSQPANTKSIKPRWQDDIGYRNVFTCSMADLFGKWVPQEWIESVLQVIRDNPQWTFLLLSKFPVRMAEFNYPPNVWLGTTVDYQHAVDRAEKAFTKIKASGFNGVCWLSCEPMMERLTFSSLKMFDWIVMGGSSKSTQTPEYRPPFDDINHLYNQARRADCMVYQKTNLIPGMSDEQRIREYPLQS